MKPSRVASTGLSGLSAEVIAGSTGTGLTAAGTTTTDALELVYDNSYIGTVAAGTGVRLLAGEAGETAWIYNGGANTVLVYPPTGGTINNLATNTAVGLDVGKSMLVKYRSATVVTASGDALTSSGAIYNRGRMFFQAPTPETATDTASLTDAQMLSGILVATPTAAAAYTVRTGTQLKAALPATLAANDSFDLTIINIGGTGDDITLTAATDITIVGDAVVRPSADSGTEQGGQGTFRFRFVTGTTFVAYRIS